MSEASETLRKAWAAVKEARLPEEIHEVAFREAVRLMVSSPTSPGARHAGEPGGNGNWAAAGGKPGESSNGEGGITVTEEEIYDRVVAQADIERDKLEQLVDLDDGVLRISIPGLKLGKTNAERVRAVAQILTITRGFGIEEGETSLQVIRTECDRLHLYDQSNFSSDIRALSGYVITGTGTNRRLRAKGPGIAAFPELVDKVVG